MICGTELDLRIEAPKSLAKLVKRMVPSDSDVEAARDLELRQDRGGVANNALEDHSGHRGASRRVGDHGELDGPASIRARMAPRRLLGRIARPGAGFDVEFDDVALGRRASSSDGRRDPSGCQGRSTLRTPFVGEVAADFAGPCGCATCSEICSGRPGVRSDLGDRLEDEVEIADGHALGKQELEDRFAGRNRRSARDKISSMRRLYSGVEPVEQRAHVLVGERSDDRLLRMTSLKWVNRTDREIDRILKPCRYDVVEERLGDA